MNWNVMALWEQFNHTVPSVVIALLILLLAFLCAWIVKKLVEKFMAVIKVDNLFKKAGIDDERRDKTKDFIAKLAYLVTFVLLLPGIFQKLGLNDSSPYFDTSDIKTSNTGRRTRSYFPRGRRRTWS